MILLCFKNFGQTLLTRFIFTIIWHFEITMDIRTYVGVLLMMMVLQSVSVESVTSRDLIHLNNFVDQSVYRYQARCSLPCSGVYNRGQFNVTIVLDQICSNIQTQNFAPTQNSSSAVWYISNTNTISANSNNQCVFDVQFDYLSVLPTGTCNIGWETPTDCSMTDDNGIIMQGWMTCDDVTQNNLDACYNQTTFSKCCNACNLKRINVEGCPFGDFRPWTCTSLTDDRCYDPDVLSNCCETCDDIARSRTQIADCPYGDRNQNFCNQLEPHQCYQHDYRCCDTCYWNAYDNQPECRYGDRKPVMCSSILINDCYNNTIAKDCCGTCKLLQNNDNPDCLYGDKAQFCDNLLRRRCYESYTLDTCCETCVELEDTSHADCAYGDKRDCSGETRSNCDNAAINRECCETCRFLKDNDCTNNQPDKCYSIISRDCYNANTRQDCCYACLSYYADNAHLNDEDCGFGNKRRGCYYDIDMPHQCYDDDIEEACCETCYYYQYEAYIEADDCKYGDRTPDECMFMNSTECYDSTTERNCCETCHYYAVSHLPNNCRYGDKDSVCYSTEPWNCYDQYQAEMCCDTCTWYDQSEDLGNACRYGDRRYDCYNESNYICYDQQQRKECCKFCHNKENTANVGCEFGDKSEQCFSMKAMHCYDLENECCDTCPRLVSIHQDTIANCKYGDRINCSDVTTQDCSDASTAFACCETCWLHSQNNNNAGCSFGDSSPSCGNIDAWECYTRENECCNTCNNLVLQNIGISHCKYGDRTTRCATIEPHQCYDGAVAYECCEQCYNYRRSNLPYNCQYGDKITSCTSSQHHPSECYNDSLRSQCCETCLDIKTNNRECEYGDKNVQCDSVRQMPASCYNQTISRVCCQSCPELENNNYPGCEYGDRYEYCQTSNCDKYTSTRLYECCSTCSNYIQNGGSSTYTPQGTTTSDPNKTDKQTKSTTTTTATEVIKTTTTTTTTTLPITAVSVSDPDNDDDKDIDKDDDKDDTDRNTVSSTRFDTETTSIYPASTMANSFSDSTVPIVAGAVGGVLFVAIVMIIGCYCLRTRRLKGSKKSHHEKHSNPTLAGLENNGPYSVSQATTRPPPGRQEPKKDEEVYDYINDSDVRSLPSVRRPAVPFRDQADTEGAAYVEPTSNGNPNYFNPAYESDSSTNIEHTYHVLQKQSDVGHDYMKM